jgi:hypothetical protein
MNHKVVDNDLDLPSWIFQNIKRSKFRYLCMEEKTPFFLKSIGKQRFNVLQEIVSINEYKNWKYRIRPTPGQKADPENCKKD